MGAEGCSAVVHITILDLVVDIIDAGQFDFLLVTLLIDNEAGEEVLGAERVQCDLRLVAL